MNMPTARTSDSIARRLARSAWVFGLVAAAGASIAFADGPRVRATPTNSGGGGTRVIQIPDPNSPEARAHRDLVQRREASERELLQLRREYFRVKNTEIRQVGIDKLRQFSDPAAFPAMLEIFGDCGDDVVGGMLDHLAELRNDEADATIAWAAVFGDSSSIRELALEQLVRRYPGGMDESHLVPRRVQSVVAIGLRSPSSREATRAAGVTEALGLVQAIPLLIQAQARGGGDIQAGDGTESLGWILVGTQQAFVSDLEPVVGDSAVGFDPELAVATEGVVMQINGASVITYRVELHRSLDRLATKAWGRSTDQLGWNQRAWKQWHDQVFKPYWAQHIVQTEAQRQAETEVAADDREPNDAAPTKPAGG